MLPLFLIFPVIFRVYDSDGNGKVSFNDMLEVLQDLTGPFISEVQREVVFVFYFFDAFVSYDLFLMRTIKVL